jgi:Secretion system C-terminal sorting domain/Beta-propeller repeat
MRNYKFIFIIIYILTIYNIYAQEPELIWRNYYSPSKEIISDIVLDSLGNVYITGGLYNDLNGYDYCTIKYSLDGTEIWRRIYNGMASSKDIANKISIDKQGNVYVTGGSIGIDTDFDYVTIKYNNNGEEQWIKRYNGSDSLADNAIDIVVNNMGSVYVTGVSTKDIGNHNVGNCVVIKYDSSGNEEWTTIVDNGLYSWIVKDLAISNQGNVFITGYGGSGGSTLNNILTAKINQNGSLSWSKVHNGSGNGNDEAIGIVVDNNNNSYIAANLVGNEMDIGLIKYDTNGNEIWALQYSSNDASSFDEVSDMLLENNIIYLSGHLFDKWTILEYNYDGNLVKEIIDDYNMNSNSHQNFLSKDNDGNLYLCGSKRYWGYPPQSNIDLRKYDSDGNLIWSKGYDGVAHLSDIPSRIALYDTSNIYVVGTSGGEGTGTDFLTLKYNESGALKWERRVTGANISYYLNFARKILYLSDKVILATNTHSGYGKRWDWLMLGFNSNSGNLDMERIYSRYIGGQNLCYDLTDAGDYFLATGLTYRILSSDITSLRGNAYGWIAPPWHYNNSTYTNDIGYSIKAINSNEFIVAGSTGNNAFLAKYEIFDDTLWTKSLNLDNNYITPEKIVQLEIDNMENIISLGEGSDSLGVFILKFNQNGEKLWNRNFPVTKTNTEAKSIAIDSKNNIVTITKFLSDDNLNYLLIKMDNYGDIIWQTQIECNDTSYFNGLVMIDGDDNIITLTLQPIVLPIYWKIILSKYSSEGELIWQESYYENNYYFPQPRSLIKDNNNNIFILLYSGLSGQMLKYSQDGMNKWILNIPDSGEHFIPETMIIRTNGDIYTWGTTMDSPGGKIITIYKYHDDEVQSINEFDISKSYLLEQNYPNPFNPTTKIRFSIPELQLTTLKIYDILGREVVTLLNKEKPAGTYEVEFNATNLPSGIYFYRIQAGSYIKTRKMVLLK